MNKISTILFCFLVSLSYAKPFDPEGALIEIEITKKTYDYKIPWVSRNGQISKNGILVGKNQILTTADGLSGQYISRITKGGESRQYTAGVKWIDYYANVAMLDVSDPEFWEGMAPVELASSIPQSGELQIYRWSSGRIEERSAEIIRLYNGTSKLSYLSHLKLSVSSEITSAGWAEVVFDGDQLVGLTESANSNNRLSILPSPFIAGVLERKSRSDNVGLGAFDFEWMYAKNPALTQSKGFEKSDVGVVVTEVGGKRLSENALEVGDVILSIDSFEIDSEGKYLDPEYGRLSFPGLATRAHAADEVIPMTIWRDGAEYKIEYTLPRAQFEKSLIPQQRNDAPPQYLIAGGLLFQPVNGPLIRSFGSNKPLLLDYYSSQSSVNERDGLVLLSAVLPDDYNRGYEDMRYLLVNQINGQTIHGLEDIQNALTKVEGEFHRIEFMLDEVMQQIVLDAAEMPAATQRILQHYRIPAVSSL